MLPFAEVILRALVDYKVLLHKIYSPTQAEEQIKRLGIKTIQINKLNDNEPALYDIASKIVMHLEEYLHTPAAATCKVHRSCFGVFEFLNYLRNFIHPYKVYGGKIIYTARAVTSALTTALQIIPLPHHRITDELIHKLVATINFIMHHGNETHVAILSRALHEHKQTILIHLGQYREQLKIANFFAQA
jgi:hypothetical protein